MIEINIIDTIDTMRALADNLIKKLDHSEKVNYTLRKRIEVLENTIDEDFCTIETLQSQISRYQRKLNELKSNWNISKNRICTTKWTVEKFW